MCLILDANKYSEFLNPDNEDMQPVRSWIKNQNGKIVYAPTEKLETELNNHQQMKKWIRESRRAGKVKMIDEETVNKTAIHLTGLSSNDEHIIALAIVSETKLLGIIYLFTQIVVVILFIFV